MPKQQKLKFSIRQDGTVSEEVFGAVGNECENLTRSIEENLGMEVMHERNAHNFPLDLASAESTQVALTAPTIG